MKFMQLYTTQSVICLDVYIESFFFNYAKYFNLIGTLNYGTPTLICSDYFVKLSVHVLTELVNISAINELIVGKK